MKKVNILLPRFGTRYNRKLDAPFLGYRETEETEETDMAELVTEFRGVTFRA